MLSKGSGPDPGVTHSAMSVWLHFVEVEVSFMMISSGSTEMAEQPPRGPPPPPKAHTCHGLAEAPKLNIARLIAWYRGTSLPIFMASKMALYWSMVDREEVGPKEEHSGTATSRCIRLGKKVHVDCRHCTMVGSPDRIGGRYGFGEVATGCGDIDTWNGGGGEGGGRGRGEGGGGGGAATPFGPMHAKYSCWLQVIRSLDEATLTAVLSSCTAAQFPGKPPSAHAFQGRLPLSPKSYSEIAIVTNSSMSTPLLMSPMTWFHSEMLISRPCRPAQMARASARAVRVG